MPVIYTDLDNLYNLKPYVFNLESNLYHLMNLNTNYTLCIVQNTDNPFVALQVITYKLHPRLKNINFGGRRMWLIFRSVHYLMAGFWP